MGHDLMTGCFWPTPARCTGPEADNDNVAPELSCGARQECSDPAASNSSTVSFNSSLGRGSEQLFEGVVPEPGHCFNRGIDELNGCGAFPVP